MQTAKQLVIDLGNLDLRENALLDLSKDILCAKIIWGIALRGNYHASLSLSNGEYLDIVSCCVVLNLDKMLPIFKRILFLSALSQSSTTDPSPLQVQTVEQLVMDLSNLSLRENALLELSKKRELFQDLAPLLWNSFGSIAALLQEIVSIYPVLSPPNLSPAHSNRVCNALALLQCVASHHDTRMSFLEAHIPMYLYPFLNTTSKSRPFEYLRLTSLGVIWALVKVNDSEVMNFLLSTEIIPLCLRTMEMGSELSKTVATFIVQKILLDEMGLDYICTTAERFFAVGRVLANMVAALAEQPSPRLLKHIIRCYLCLSDNPRACDALRSCLPDMLRDGTFSKCLMEDSVTRRWLQQLLHNVQDPRAALLAGVGFERMLG